MTHVGHERLVAYWASDLEPAELDAIEAHLFGCAECTAELEQLARIVQAFRGLVPPVIDAGELARLHAGGLAIVETRIAPGVPTEVTFARGVDLLIHRLGGLALAGAERVEVIIRSESAGALFTDGFAPFDRDRGEVLVACQRHFAAYPRDVAIDVRVHAAPAPPVEATYRIPHVFER